MLARIIVAVGLFVGIAMPAAALEGTRWPPSEADAARMHELQKVIEAADSTAAQRVAARTELAAMLMSPAGQQRGLTPVEETLVPPRSTLLPDPVPSLVNPVNIAPPPAPLPEPGVAHLDVTQPPRPVINPRTGSVVAPLGNNFAIDPRTGSVLQDTGTGFVNPRTGQFIPR